MSTSRLPIIMPALSTLIAADALLFENYIRMNDDAKRAAQLLDTEDIGETGAIWSLPDRPDRLAASFAGVPTQSSQDQADRALVCA